MHWKNSEFNPDSAKQPSHLILIKGTTVLYSLKQSDDIFLAVPVQSKLKEAALWNLFWTHKAQAVQVYVLFI